MNLYVSLGFFRSDVVASCCVVVLLRVHAFRESTRTVVGQVGSVAC